MDTSIFAMRLADRCPFAEDSVSAQGDAKVKKTIWQPLVLGLVLGLLAGIATVTGLSFFVIDFTDNTLTIGFYASLFLLAAALGGPLSGVVASTLWVVIGATYGTPDMKEVITIPAIFWSNVFALGTTVALTGFSYRMIFERFKMPIRLLPWVGIVLAFYIIALPASLTPQYVFLGSSTSDILPAIRSAYATYFPQAIFDIFFTSLVFIALPVRYSRPLWIELQSAALSTEDREKGKAL